VSGSKPITASRSSGDGGVVAHKRVRSARRDEDEDEDGAGSGDDERDGRNKASEVLTNDTARATVTRARIVTYRDVPALLCGAYRNTF
jgi:hypothetical protein